MGCFILRQLVLFDSKGRREANDRDGRLDSTGALYHPLRLVRYSHGAAGDGSERIQATSAIWRQGRTRTVGELLNQAVDDAIIPVVYGRVRLESRVSRFEF